MQYDSLLLLKFFHYFRDEMKLSFWKPLILFLFIPTFLLRAQSEPISFDHLSVEDGLSQSTVWCIFQDSRGFMWFGTRDGLNKYDGYHFKIYKKDMSNPQSLSENDVKAIYEDRLGTLWIGTYGGGLNKFDREKETFIHYKHDPNDSLSLSENDVWAIYEDREGLFWIGTLGGGVNKFDRENESFKRYVNRPDDPASLSNNLVFSIYEDHSGTLWVGTNGGGLNRFDRKTEKFFHYLNDPGNPGSLSNNYVTSIHENKLGEVWIGTFGGGLNKFDREKGIFTHYKHDPGNFKSLSHNSIRAIYEDQSGSLWIGTSGGGLSRLNRKTQTFEHYTNDIRNPNSLKNNIVFSMYQDRSGVFWIGTYEGGLSKFDRFRRKFTHYKNDPFNANSLSHNNVYAINEDQASSLWIGTYGGGLNKFDRLTNKVIHYKNDPNNLNSLSNDWVTAIHEDRFGMLWIGTFGGGLNKLVPSDNAERRPEGSPPRFIHYKNDPDNPNSLSDNTIRTIYEDQSGTLWIGTLNGLNKLDSGLNKSERKKFTIFKNDPNNPGSLSHNDIYSIYEDQKGILWFGTIGGGLNKLVPSASSGQALSETEGFDRSKQNFSHYKNEPNNANSLSDNTVHSIFEDQKGIIWIGTRGGLNRFDSEKKIFTHYIGKDGLPNDVVYAILEDRSGNLWLSTNKGLSKFNPNIVATSEKPNFRNYDISDGLQSYEFNAGAYYQNKNGEMFFGGVKGFNSFYPDEVKNNLNVPQIAITDFQIFNKTVPIGGNLKASHSKSPLNKHISETKEITLTYKESVFSFEFSALNYTSSEKNQYAYMMEGFDRDWIYVGNKRDATYTNLDPGEYTFRVKGANYDGIWNEEGTAIKITITPPLWQTWWFRVLFSLLIVGIVITGVKTRIRNIETQKKTLEKLVTERTYELKERTNELENQKQVIENQSQKLLEMDEIKSRFFANISHEFRTPLTLILGPLNDMLTDEEYPGRKSTFLSMRRNAKRLLRLINQLLDLSKLETRKMQLNLSQGNIVAFVKGIVLSFSSMAERKNIILDFKTKNEYINFSFDRDKLEKIIYNLLSNAFKFTPEQGKINLAMKDFSDFIEITVKDTGRGIPQEKLDSVFERFYQGGHSRETDQEGTGIGLALTKELVELHDGEIDVESEVGKGTRFVICLPHRPDKLQPDDISENSKAGDLKELFLENENNEETKYAINEDNLENDDETSSIILIIEDNADVQSYIREHLTPAHQIISAMDGEEGVEKAKNLIPDLIISDVMMPKMDGYEVCRILKKNEKTSHIPIILLTARASDESKLEGLETGADDYLTKPFDSRELQARVKNLVEQRRRLQERYRREIVLQPGEIAITSLDETFLQKVCEIIEKYMTDPDFGSVILRDELGMSRTQFHRKLRALTNQTPGQLIRSMRLERAKQLLGKGAGSVTEIAYEVGFNNLSYFAKCFREQFGKLPSEFDNYTP